MSVPQFWPLLALLGSIFPYLTYAQLIFNPPPLTSQGHRLPYNLLVILPARESKNDVFGLTIDKARPVIDIAVQNVTAAGIMPPGWLNLTYWDSRFWDDVVLAERYATVGVVQAYCEHRLDAIMGFADNYGLATVTKVTAGLNGGIPVITTAGMPASLNSKKAYPFLTRMQGSYRQMASAIHSMIAYHEEGERNSTITLNFKHMLFFYHDKRRAVNKVTKEDSQDSDDISSHCYFSLYAIKNLFMEKSSVFKAEWAVSTPSFGFDEEQPITRDIFKSWLKDVSMKTNGESFFL